MHTISIVEDDPADLDALRLVLIANGYDVDLHRAAQTLLDASRETSCVITDLRLTGIGGLELIETLRERADPRPVIIVSGAVNVELAVAAMKAGAIDVLEKPVASQKLLDNVAHAVSLYEDRLQRRKEIEDLQQRFDSLTKRQQETMHLLVDGLTNKDIAGRLGISPRTVEIYRAWVLSKMHANSLADLVKMSLKLRRNRAFF